MLVLQQAYEVQASIQDYLKATFNFKDRDLQAAFRAFLNDSEEGLFKGPYLSIKLPFVKALDQEIPLEIVPSFPPYDHQYKAFQRLSTRGGRVPTSTLITTGTASGKTESFLYPVLDYCYNQYPKPGIKAIILYPMNALATDQAKRIAEIIWGDPRLRGKISAGLLIGEGKEKKKYPLTMGSDHIIENRQSILDSPPDILLTNFKMLDYALLRSQYHSIWHYNLQDPQRLQFLVLDELHTYDGAQGSDVANLIRRLKLKLSIPSGHLCAVGTSATIGEGADSAGLMLEYAHKVFGEPFDQDALISENRIEADEFFQGEEAPRTHLPIPLELAESRLKYQDTYSSYLSRQRRLWLLPDQGDPSRLGMELKQLRILKDLLKATGGKTVSLQLLMRELAHINPGFRELPEWDTEHQYSPRAEIIQSLLALLGEAKSADAPQFPFMFVQVHLWVRELSGVLRTLKATPGFEWKDSPPRVDAPRAMPSYYCRECGASGWLVVKDDNKNSFSRDTQQVYSHFFSNHKNIYFVNTPEHKPVPEYEADTRIESFLNPKDLSLHDTQGEGLLPIYAVRKVREAKARHICPECNTENTIGIIGTRVPTLSSITVSQILASDLDIRMEKERKILAFTNSVQDAAHQAAFVEARNYRFTFRASLQRVLNALNKPVNLRELSTYFFTYWKQLSDESRQHPEEAYFYRFFPSDYSGKADLAKDYRDQQGFTEAFRKEFDLRLEWELLAEFGYNARIGRTLEKTGASGVRVDSDKIGALYPKMADWLAANNLGMIQDTELQAFANGILHRIRMRGGIDHTYLSKFRSGKQEPRELNWWQDNRHFLNHHFGTRTRFPKLLTDQPHQRGMLDSTWSVGPSWYRNYFLKSFPLAPDYPRLVQDFYSQFLDALVEVGLLNCVGTPDNRNFAIVPEALIAENKVRQYACTSCGSELFVAASDTLCHQTACLSYTCAEGRYAVLPDTPPNYYQLVYNRNRAPRIFAAEHTGLLERDDRERKEMDFKKRPHFNSLNTLVATSTLEMGIDIGTLHTAINNSVPPLPANFVQRIGRAGRQSGSALLIHFAQSAPHDLYYYQEPLDMMEGDIQPPGCFLEAKDILFRHFFAFCLDSWSTADPARHRLPGVLLPMQLLRADLHSPDFLSNRISTFIWENQEELLERFREMYRPDLANEKVLEELDVFLKEGLLFDRLKKVFRDLQLEYQYIFEKRKEIEDYIRQHHLAETDAERRILEQEKKELYGVKRLLDKRAVLEHLTNKGMLPNYAFPETGITLNGRINFMQPKGSDTIPGYKQVELVRPAATGLTEFAPDNQFYALGYKFFVSGLNTFDWKEAGTLQKKRFCSQCDHLQISVQDDSRFCPKCGDESWSSVLNQHTFVRLNGVKSVNLGNYARLDDSSEDRDSSAYKISRHFHFEPGAFQGAWGMKEIPFGVEFVKQVRVETVNLGLSSSVHANKITIHGIDQVPNHGFITCKHCGKSTAEPNREAFDKRFSFHYGYCRYKNQSYQGKTDEVFEEVFLFRQMHTEALKILLPVQDLDGEAQVNMFKAGLELGLKKYYKGNPQHLSLSDYREYNPQNARFDRYLVLHDQISGGTGYLEKLFHPVEFTDVLQRAYTAIRDCGCQFQGKDGCYRCIYTYTNQRIQGQLSRAQAEKLFARIVEKSDAWEEYNSGLGALSGNGQIEESELEERFIRSLRRHCEQKAAAGWHFENYLQDGVQHYKLYIQNHQTRHRYYYLVRPQYSLGSAEGVAYRTRTDFYISLIQSEPPLAETISGQSSFRDIALYLDGYTYHASAENQRFIQDVRKRAAIVASGDKLTWTLTWDDLDCFDSTEEAKRKDSLDMGAPRFDQTRNKLRRAGLLGMEAQSLLNTSNSMERLLWILENPAATQPTNTSLQEALLTLQSSFGYPSVPSDEIANYFGEKLAAPDPSLRTQGNADGSFWVFPEIQLDKPGIVQFLNAVQLKNRELKSKVQIYPIEGAMEKDVWQRFWHLYNITQSDTEVCLIEDTPTVSQTENADPYACLENHDPTLHTIIRQLIDLGIPFARDGGFFIQHGHTFAEAMLGFTEARLFIHPLSERDREIFLLAGYREETIETFNPKTLLP